MLLKACIFLACSGGNRLHDCALKSGDYFLISNAQWCEIFGSPLSAEMVKSDPEKGEKEIKKKKKGGNGSHHLLVK